MIEKVVIPFPEVTLASISIVTRIYRAIASRVALLEDASRRDFRSYHHAVIDLDHILLADLETPTEAEEILSQARKGGLLVKSQELYRPYETILEESFARLFLASPGVNFLGDDNITHNYLARYHTLAANEAELAEMTAADRVLFIGSGPFPISAIEYARQTRARVDCVEMLTDKANTSQYVIDRLGFSHLVKVHNADGQSFPAADYSVIVVGVMAQPKQAIIDNIERNGRSNVRLLSRTTHRLRQFIYPAAEFQTNRLAWSSVHYATKDQALSTMLLK